MGGFGDAAGGRRSGTDYARSAVCAAGAGGSASARSGTGAGRAGEAPHEKAAPETGQRGAPSGSRRGGSRATGRRSTAPVVGGPDRPVPAEISSGAAASGGYSAV